jgi:hypothetical protein
MAVGVPVAIIRDVRRGSVGREHIFEELAIEVKAAPLRELE